MEEVNSQTKIQPSPLVENQEIKTVETPISTADFEAVFGSFGDTIEDFQTILANFSEDFTVKNGNFDPSRALAEWPAYLENLNTNSASLKRLAESMKKEIAESKASLALTQTAEVQEEMDVFDYLYQILDLFIEMTTTLFELSMSYALVLEQITETQKVYLTMQDSLDPMTTDLQWLEDKDDEETVDAINTWNQVMLPNYKQSVNSYNEMSQDTGKQVNSIINQLTQAATKISDDYSTLLGKLSSLAFSIFK